MDLNGYFEEMLEWFCRYSRTFLTGDAGNDHGIELKILHTEQVEGYADVIAGSLNSRGEDPGRERCGAKLSALLHDVGRFRQFRKYRTFNDSVSEDHGKLALTVLDEEGVLGLLGKHDNELLQAVRFAVFEHNKLTIPDNAGPLPTLLAKIVRDADRIDIFNIMAEQLAAPESENREAVFLHLPETGAISDSVFTAVMAGEMVHRDDLQNRNDFLCLILSWINIMNFPVSCRIIEEAGTLEKVLGFLPTDEKGRMVETKIRGIMQRKPKEGLPKRSSTDLRGF